MRHSYEKNIYKIIIKLYAYNSYGYIPLGGSNLVMLRCDECFFDIYDQNP
jgi:hypothetical protein